MALIIELTPEEIAAETAAWAEIEEGFRTRANRVSLRVPDVRGHD